MYFYTDKAKKKMSSLDLSCINTFINTIEKVLKKLKELRKITDKHDTDVKISKISGSTLGLIGGIGAAVCMFIPVVGLPIAILTGVFTGVGVTGGVISFGAMIGDQIRSKGIATELQNYGKEIEKSYDNLKNIFDSIDEAAQELAYKTGSSYEECYSKIFGKIFVNTDFSFVSPHIFAQFGTRIGVEFAEAIGPALGRLFSKFAGAFLIILSVADFANSIYNFKKKHNLLEAIDGLILELENIHRELVDNYQNLNTFSILDA